MDIFMSMDEVKKRKKLIFGKGDYHKLYPSKQYPDRLWKVGPKEIVDKWVEVFNEYPQYFPKVYKVIENPNYPGFVGVLIEKVDTNRAEHEFEAVNHWLFNSVKINGVGVTLFSVTEEYHAAKIFSMVNAVEDTPEVKAMVKKWLALLYKLDKILVPEYKKYVDFHGGNFAYRGNDLICIDI